MIPELILLQHLAEKLNVTVAMEKRNDPTYVLIERLGGTDDGFLRTASFAIQSYGPTLYEACRLNEQVKKAMRSLIENKDVTRCDLDSDYNYTDTATKKYRYQAVYDLVLFGEE